MLHTTGIFVVREGLQQKSKATNIVLFILPEQIQYEHGSLRGEQTGDFHLRNSKKKKSKSEVWREEKRNNIFIFYR